MKDLCIHMARLSLERDKAHGCVLGPIDSYREKCIEERCGHWDSDKGCCSLVVVS